MKYEPSALLGPLSGSLGSTTAAKNRFGHYLRSKTKPVTVTTRTPTARRSLLVRFAQEFRTLTDSQVRGWQDYATATPEVDKQGNSRVLTALQKYCQVNCNLANVGLSTITSPPLLSAAPPIIQSITLTPTGGAGTISVAYVAANGAAGNRFYIQFTAPLSPGIRRIPDNAFRQVSNIAGNAASPYAAVAPYEVVFGSSWRTQIGMRIGVRIVGVSEGGERSTYFTQSALIV